MSRPSRDARHDAAGRLHSAAIHLLRAVRKVDSAMGLGPAKSSALSVLVFGGPRSLGELAAAEGVKPPSMTRVVQELVAEGLVKRRTDKEDRRAVRLEATAKAVRILREGRSRRAALLAESLGQLDESEFAKIQAALPVLEKTSDFVLRKP
ncbi:MAG TPA: MarR family transcriptional regulator [Vicinamibacterales bacterium]|nr:MarR family transcriptional regulator [Vicinamibacterales bacterium]